MVIFYLKYYEDGETKNSIRSTVATRWSEKGPKKLDLPSLLCHSPIFILSCDTRVLQLRASSIALPLCLDDDQHHLPDKFCALRGIIRIPTWAYEWMLHADCNRPVFYVHRLDSDRNRQYNMGYVFIAAIFTCVGVHVIFLMKGIISEIILKFRKARALGFKQTFANLINENKILRVLL